MGAQEELESYEGILYNHCGLGKRRVPTEFSEIGRIDSSMTELIGISRNTGITTGVSRISSTTLATTDHTGIGSKIPLLPMLQDDDNKQGRGHHWMK